MLGTVAALTLSTDEMMVGPAEAPSVEAVRQIPHGLLTLDVLSAAVTHH